MKRIFSGLLIAIMLVTALPFAAFPANAAGVSDLSYTISDGKATITDCNTSATGALEIPATLDGFPVTSIGSFAFYDCDNLTSVTIPDSVTIIGNYAFYGCSSLEKVTITDLAAWCKINFRSDCSNPLCYGELYLNGDLVTDLIIPDGITSIRDYAFYGYDSLTSVTIPDSVATIGSYAFHACDGLTSVTIGNGVTSIGNGAFSACGNLRSIHVDGQNPYYCTEDGIIFSKDKSTLVCCPGKSGAYTIPDSVTTIGNYAFYECDSLTSVSIPDGVTTIGNYAFYYCDSLTSITIPDGVTSIGSYAFDYCRSLTSVTIPDSVTTIGDSAFRNCDSLTSVTIGNGVTIIGYFAFGYCDSLTSVNIPDSVTIIGNYAFYDCDNLTSVTIPDSVTTIGNYAFYGCSSLEKVTITDLAAWCKINFGSDCSNPLCYGELYLNGDLVTDLIIPDGVTSIRDYAFYGYDSLTSVTIPDSVTSIGSSAFEYCRNLTSVTIGNGVTSIGNGAFSACGNLRSIHVDGQNPYYCTEDGVLFSKDKSTLVCHPAGKSGAYTIPESVTSIGNYAFDNCDSLTSITIPESVTSIGDSAFEDCDSLTSVTIGNGVTTIGSYAFEDCDSLTSVTIGNGVTSIGDSAFRNCDSLTSVTIGNGVTIIGYFAFDNCDNLTSVNIPDSVTIIGNYAFDDCDNLTSVNIPDSVTTIGDYAFGYCYSLTDVWYQGSESQKASISFGDPTGLADKMWHYNTCKADCHIYPADCDTTCENCDWTRTATVPHDYQGQYNEQQHYQECTVCKERNEVEDHSFDHACDTTCNDGCGYVRTITHDYKVQYNGQQHYQECTVCKERNEVEDHSFDHACDTTCNDGCGYVRTITHDYKVQYNGQQHYQECSGCKEKINFEDHSFDHACDTTCNGGCGYVRTITHDYKVQYNGRQHYQKCSVCKVETGFEDHSFDHVCDTTCNDGCGYVRTTTHDYQGQYNEQQHYQECSGCKEKIEVEDHSFDHACDTTCNGGCGYVRSITHDYKAQYNEQQHYQECTVCKKRIEVEDHSFDHVCDTTCNGGCGYVRAPAHKILLISLQNSATDPFSYSNGVYTSTNKANNSSSTFTIEALYDCTLTIEYSVSSEKKYDKLTISKGSTPLDTISGTVSGKTLSVPMKAGDLVTLMYSKDSSQASGKDSASFKVTAEGSVYVPAEEVAHYCHLPLYCDLCGEVAVEAKDHNFTRNGGHTCEECGFSRVSSAPTVEHKDSGVVRLTAIEGFEYSMDGTNWQDSNEFSHLSAEQTYRFYQRVKETQTVTAGAVSEPLVLTLKAYQEPPAPPIVITFTDTVIQLLPAEGCEYSIDGRTWTSSPLFEGLSPAVKYTLYQRYPENTEAEASVASTTLCTTDKSTQAAPSSAPTLAQFTANSITLTAIDGYEYSRDGINWQTSPTFTNLSCGRTYLFYQRVAATSTHYASKSSPSAQFKTDKGTQVAPNAPVLVQKTHDTVVLQAQSDCEYSYDTIHWQSEPIFTGLKPETNYLFYCRKTENEYYYAGAISTALVVRTNEVPKCSENGAHLYDDSCDEDCNYCGELRYDAHRYANACDATCEDCGKYRIPSQHIYSTPCDPACNICGAERIGSPHTYTNRCDKDCNICGAVREVVDHDYDNACDAICNVCGAYREPSDHVYSNACDIDCNVCGAYRIVGDHVYSNGCDTSCNECGDIRDVPPHTYSSDCDTSCNECGEIRTAQNHTYSSDCDTTCNQCGEIRTAGAHLYSSRCDSTCNECGEIREVIHSFGEYSYDNNATSLKDGTKTRTCTVCGEKDTVVVPGTKLEREIRDSSAIFRDVKPNDWFKPAVDFVFTHEIMFGTGDGTTFSPSGIMNRAMLVTMLYRLEGSPAVSGNHGFIDVGDNQWYTDAIIWASQNGIVSGKGGGRFAPSEALTRASFVSILYRYAEYCGEDVSARADLSAFADEANVPTWARANIEWAVAKGLLSGSTKNGALYINPTGKANRAQGATLLQKFCEM